MHHTKQIKLSILNRNRIFFLFKSIITSQINESTSVKICLSDVIPSHESLNFRGSLKIHAHVTASDGSSYDVIDDSTKIASHKVELKFSKDTKENFKPLMGYTGKVCLYKAFCKYTSWIFKLTVLF